MNGGAGQARAKSGPEGETAKPGDTVPAKTWKVDDMGLVIFFRSLAVLQGAGIPLVSCLSALAQSVDGDLRTVCTEMARMLARGHTISGSLQKFSPVFSGFHVHLVKVGEETGTLNRVLFHIADHEEARLRLLQSIRSALLYPTIVATVALVGLVALPPFVLKGIFEVIRQAGAEPPLLTRVVMTVSSALGSPFLWIILALLTVLAFKPLIAALTGARWRPFLMSVPGLGRSLRCATSARFASALALCLRAGLNIQRSLALSALASGDPLLQERIELARAAIEDGHTIAEGLRRVNFFSPLFLEFLASGEEVGRVDDMLRRLAGTLEKDLAQELRTYASLLEPLMLLIVGAIVGVLVIATATPMLNLIKTLG